MALTFDPVVNGSKRQQLESTVDHKGGLYHNHRRVGD